MIYEDDYHEKIIPHDLWTTTLSRAVTTDGETAQGWADAVEDLALAVSLHNREAADGDNWTVALTTMGRPEEAALRERLPEDVRIISEKLPEKDWLSHVHDNFPPVVSGQFYIYGSHYTGEKPANLTHLKIDAATAFGSGEHETTRGCLLALEHLKAQGVSFKNGLDMGCGSGILAIAMLKLWPEMAVAAVDIDPESVIVTHRHAEMNGVKLQAQAGDGYNAPLAGQNAPYDIIAANILANPLIEMAPALHKALKPGGYAVLSGLLQRQRDEVVAAHTALGLTLVRIEEIGTPETGLWQALLFQK